MEGRPLDLQKQLLMAARKLAAERPPEKVTLADVARAAGVSWHTARRLLGGKAQLRALLAHDRSEPEASSADTRSRLLAAAERVFATHGYAGATLDQVAAAAGLTKGAVYWHFASKADLFLCLLEERSRRQMAEVTQMLQVLAAAPDLQGSLATLLAAQLESCQADPTWPRLYLEFLSHSREPEVQERLARHSRLWLEAVRDLIRDLQQQGRLAGADPLKLAALFQAILNGLVLLALAQPGLVDPQAWAPELSAILWQGVRPPS
jgi:AcrR family transcriptional regulator